jgi:electron transfer flavoprotein alpha subunit
MKLLVYAEIRAGKVTDNCLGVVNHARMHGDVHVVVPGKADEELLALLAANGAQLAHVVAGEELPPLPAPHAAAVLQAYQADTYDVILLAGSVLAMDVAGHVAAKLEAGINWELTELAVADGQLIGVRPVFDDSLLVEVGWTSDARVAVFRPGALAPMDHRPTDTEVDVAPVYLPAAAEADVVLESAGVGAEAASAASLAKAKVIVSAGRGIGSRENLQLVRDLAAALGGLPGVSLPLVSAGWAPYSMQVGQTGAVVRPDLYVACGISGQVQHRTGMQFAKTIVAINTDEEAPIAWFCDLFVHADVLKVLPELTRLMRGE